MTLTVHSVWILTESDRFSVNVQYRKPPKADRPPNGRYYPTGKLEALIRKYMERQVPISKSYEPPPIPIGIWLDRLEESPEELTGATPEQVTAILKHLRQRHPNGV